MIRPIKNTLAALIFSAIICGTGDILKNSFADSASSGGKNPSYIHMTYNSDPKYAKIYSSDGQLLGECPYEVNYSVSAQDISNGQINLGNFTVKWISGAKTNVNLAASVHKTETRDGYKEFFTKESYTFERPEGIPGLRDDLGYAMDRERLELEKSNARSAESLARSARMSASEQERANNREGFNSWMDQTRKANEYYESQGWRKK